MLACFVPWAREAPKPPQKPTSKKLPSPASLAAREGIKVDHKICKLVDDGVMHLPEVIAIKDAVNNDGLETTSPLKRKQGTTTRESQGQAIRGLGSYWRSSVIYALLTQVAEAETPTGTWESCCGSTKLTASESRKVLNDYATWLSDLDSLKLLDVDQLKPIVNGKDLSKALGTKTGPWMKKALDIAMEWQLRNLEETDPAGGIAEVVERKKELGLP